MGKRRLWWPILLLAIVPLIPLWRCVLMGETIGPWSHFFGVPSREPWDVLQADACLQFAPWRNLVLQAWSRGEIPLWNEHSLCGTPLLANSQSGALYPPHIVLGTLGVSWQTALTLLAWFHLFWAGLGMFVLARRLGASALGATVGGISFSLSSFMVAWTGLASVPSTVSWIPWVLAGVVALSESPRWARLWQLAIPTAMMFFAGHLQFAAFGSMAAVVLGVWLGIANRSGKGFLCAALGFVLGVVVATPHLLPVMAYSKFSHRANTPSEEGYQAYVGLTLRPSEVGVLAHPYALGDPRVKAEADALPLSQFWPAYDRPGSNFAESAATVGFVVLVLAFAAGVRRRSTAALAGIGALGLLIALGTPLDRLLYFGVPGWSATGSPGRAIVLFVLAMCALAAFGVDRLKDLDKKGVTLVGLGAAVFGAFALSNLAQGPASALKDLVPSEDLIRAVTRGSLMHAMPFVLGSAVVALAAFAIYRRTGNGVSLVAAAVAIPLLSGATNLMQTGKIISPATGFPGRTAFINDNWSLFQTPHANWPPNLSLLNGAREIGGYDSLIHRDTVQMLNEINGRNSSPPENGNMMFIFSSADRKKLAEMGVNQIVRPNWSTEEISGPGVVSAPGGAHIEKTTYSSFVVHATGPGPLVLRDRNMDGWTATLDGRPVPIKPGLWKEVDLPKGGHLVVFSYAGPNFVPMIFALVVLAGLAFIRPKAAEPVL